MGRVLRLGNPRRKAIWRQRGTESEKCRDGPVESIVGVKEALWSSKLAVELGESGPAINYWPSPQITEDSESQEQC